MTAYRTDQSDFTFGAFTDAESKIGAYYYSIDENAGKNGTRLSPETRKGKIALPRVKMGSR